ncbi:MAG: hypothetical protein ABIR47_08090 [Candidatus Kapaibacterium sp.]
MRRFLLIAAATLLGSIGLMAFYVMWDYDPDNVSPMVAAPSYLSIFENAVKTRMGKNWADLDPGARARVLADIVAGRDGEPAREVALFKLRELPDKVAALAVIRKNLDRLDDERYEVAIGSLATLGTPAASGMLDSLYKRLNADPAAHTPLGDYRRSSFLISRAEPDLTFAFQERSRNDADYALTQAREISLFFPAHPQYLISIPNSDDVLKDFNDSRFARALAKSPVPEDVWRLPLLKTVASLRARLGETFGFLAPYFSPEKLFRDHFIIGRYGEEYLIASYKDKNVSLGETMLDVFGKLGKDFGIKKWDVDGTTVATVRNLKSGKTLSYATVGDYFVVGTDTAVIKTALHTFTSDRGASIGTDPLFNKAFAGLDQTGRKDVLLAWLDPTEYFDVVGARNPAGRHLAVVARALGKATITTDGSASSAAIAGSFPGQLGVGTMGGDDPSMLWRYIVDVRSLGKNPIDSLARLAKMDIGKQIFPFLAPSMALGYGGVDHLKREYGYSNTAFNLLMAWPLRSAPARFDSTLRLFFGRITSLVYTTEILPANGAKLWIASDTTTNDSLLKERKLQPSFAVINNQVLVIASTPAALRRAAAAVPSAPEVVGNNPRTYFQGEVKVDSFAVNSASYLKAFLLQSDRYSPQVIAGRIDPIRAALAGYETLNWGFRQDNGLRHGEGRLVARK